MFLDLAPLVYEPPTEAPVVPAAPAETAPAIPTGVAVTEAVVVPTAAQRRRQRREMHLEFFISSCLKSADACCDTLAPNSLLLCFAYIATTLAAVGAILVQQTGVPPNAPPYVACVQLHAIVMVLEVVFTALSVVVSNPELCVLWCGHPAPRAQRQRLCLLFWLLCVEVVVLLPLVAPLSLAPQPSAAGACEIDTAIVALAREPSPARALTALVVGVYFVQRVVTICSTCFVFGSLTCGAVLERPIRFLGAAVASFFAGVVALGYVLYSRRVANVLVWLIASCDRAVAELFLATELFGSPYNASAGLSTMGPAVTFVAAPELLGHPTPGTHAVVAALVAGLFANGGAMVLGMI